MAAESEQKSAEIITIQLARLGGMLSHTHSTTTETSQQRAIITIGSKEPFEIDLNWTVNDLLTTISNKFNLTTDAIKLLCKGKMLNNKIASKTLKSLKIKPNDKIILMNKPQLNKKQKTSKSPSLSPSTTTHTAEQKTNSSVDDAIKSKKNIEEIKAAAEKLAQRDNDGYDWNANYYLELTNQHGHKINLPNDQRQALTVGLTLHEKGKSFMKQKQYADAIYIMNLAFEVSVAIIFYSVPKVFCKFQKSEL